MKNRGFTLIELLIVTIVIATLMAIVFRLAGTGSESSRRAQTISRLQKLSNAVGGYYAAFGSYPPVPLQGRSRDIYTRVDGGGAMGYGIQAGKDEDLNTFAIKSAEKDSRLARQIEAACRAQPVAAGFPLNAADAHYEQQVFDEYNEVFHTQYSTIHNYGGFARNSVDWSENHLFMFGLMSFLLPRYQFMLDGQKEMYSDRLWLENNRLPYLMSGKRLGSWEEAQQALQMGRENWDTKLTPGLENVRTMVQQLPSQAVCARWMPNFAGIVRTIPFNSSHTVFFGVNTQEPDINSVGLDGDKLFVVNSNGYRQGGGSGDGKIEVNGLKTVVDGWGNDFYYYSPPPYQSYQLWSSGPNGRTFPPWFDKATLSQDEVDCVNKWIADDIKEGDK